MFTAPVAKTNKQITYLACNLFSLPGGELTKKLTLLNVAQFADY